MKDKRNNIIPQMFDVRPVDATGALDWRKINSVAKTVEIKKIFNETKKKQGEFPELNPLRQKKPAKKIPPNVYQLGKLFPSHEIPVFHKASEEIKTRVQEEILKKYFDRDLFARNHAEEKKEESADFIAPLVEYDWDEYAAKPEPVIEYVENAKPEKIAAPKKTKDGFRRKSGAFKKFLARKLKYYERTKQKSRAFQPDENYFRFSDLFLPESFSFNFSFGKSFLLFALIAASFSLSVGGVSFAAKGLEIRGRVLGVSQDGYANLENALWEAKKTNFKASSLEFEKAFENFSQAAEDLDQMGKTFIEISRFIPYFSKLSSGKNVIDAGQHISSAGQKISMVVQDIHSLKNPLGQEKNFGISFLEIFRVAENNLSEAKTELVLAQENLEKVNIDDLPSDKRGHFLSLKNELPAIISGIEKFLDNSHIFIDLLGGNGPRKYLFLFQNNHEMRATGGFIGSYGLLDILNGRVNNFFIDGIFNPDGQLREKIVPPKPIQKISAAWSLHDSNWFPDFPTSAQKAVYFYEKTGGPTADGVITFTPVILQRLLEITGPIEMKEYGVTLSAENFIETIQYEVEIDYDKKENNPKKILADLTPIILDKIFNAGDFQTISGVLAAFSRGLTEKHILLYSQNNDLQKIISEQGWSGEILNTSHDYLSVVNTNINGYKTDGVIDEKIQHFAEIQKDGSIVNTVTITREHKGGDTSYEWWNKVNANYSRVYVPEGSVLLSAEGQTKEFNDPPLDYDALGFKRDSLVRQEEEKTKIDPSGTRIYNEAGKTVFANWTYVSPRETATLKYKYLLPFRIDFQNLTKEKTTESYALLVQKQSGSAGSEFSSEIKHLSSLKTFWHYPELAEKSDSRYYFSTKLATDKFIAIAFVRRQ